MEHSEILLIPDSLYLDISPEKQEHALPLYSSITLFLLSYCESTSFRVILLSTKSRSQWTWLGDLPSTLASNQAPLVETPGITLGRACRLPAVVEADGMFCRAGLAVVLRHVVQRTSKESPGHLNVASLLGFKNTCLKACAEVRSELSHFNMVIFLTFFCLFAISLNTLHAQHILNTIKFGPVWFAHSAMQLRYCTSCHFPPPYIGMNEHRSKCLTDLTVGWN